MSQDRRAEITADFDITGRILKNMTDQRSGG